VTEEEAPGRAPETVQSLERGLAVIRVFDADNPRMSLSEVARRSGLTRATARRILHTLVALGYMSTDGRTFGLRPRILELGYAYLSSLSLPEVAMPHLEHLVATVHESSSVSVLDGVEIVYVARVATKRIMTVSISVGTRFPAYATSMGRVLLAGRSDDWLAGFLASTPLKPLTPYTITDEQVLRSELQKVRLQGWALVDQELEEGLRSIAAPLRDPSGEVVAAVNVSASARRGSAESVQAEILPGLLQTAAAIEGDLGAGRRAQPVG
jgi:IclR family pca regulon transcriptional regulator